MTAEVPTAAPKPLASFVCITYNHAGMLGRCLDGFLSQEVDFPVEMIVLDDASSDGTRDVLEQYAADFPGRFTLVLPETNSSQRRGNSLCEVIEHARGDFILVCEGDDYWMDSTKAQTQVDFLSSNPSFAFSFHDVLRCDAGGVQVRHMVPPGWRRDWTSREILRVGVVAFPLASICFRNVLGPLPHEFFSSPNGDTFLSVMLGTVGDGAYQGQSIRPSRSLLHAGGMYSAASAASRNAMGLRTLLNLSSWLLRRGMIAESQHLVGMEIKMRSRLLLTAGGEPASRARRLALGAYEVSAQGWRRIRGMG